MLTSYEQRGRKVFDVYRNDKRDLLVLNTGSAMPVLSSRHKWRKSNQHKTIGLRRFHRAMPTLTRRRDPDARRESWLIYYGDVHVGCIGPRSSNSTESDLWQWRCGFYGLRPGECTSGTVAPIGGDAVAHTLEMPELLHSRTHAPRSRRHGPCSSSSEPGQISRSGGLSRNGQQANMPRGNAARRCWPRRSAPPLRSGKDVLSASGSQAVIERQTAIPE